MESARARAAVEVRVGFGTVQVTCPSKRRCPQRRNNLSDLTLGLQLGRQSRASQVWNVWWLRATPSLFDPLAEWEGELCEPRA